MSSGIRIFNDNGIVQIDDLYKNFFLFKSGMVKPLQESESIFIDYAGPLIVATASENGACAACQGRTRNGTIWEYVVGSPKQGSIIKWYAFSLPIQQAFSGGLRFSDGSGSVTYDSNQKPLIISYFFDVDVPFPPKIYDGDFDRNLPRLEEIYVPLTRGRTYACFPLNINYHFEALRNPPETDRIIFRDHIYYIPEQRVGGVNFKPSVVRTGNKVTLPSYIQQRNLNSTLLPIEENRRQQYWVVDVTGY